MLQTRLRISICALALAAPSAYADESTHPSVTDVFNDAKLYYTAPLRWRDDDWVRFAGTVAVIGVAHHFDAHVRDHFADSAAKIDVTQDPHEKRDYLPAAAIVAGTFTYAALIHSHDGSKEGWTMAESAVFSAATAYALKLAAGRERPFETTQVDRWSRGGDSFPSMHTSVTFAVGAVLAESGSEHYRWLRRAIGYGASAAVTYSRLHDGQHWLSDTVAGAALGLWTADFVMDRRKGGGRNEHGSLSLAPTDRGMMLTYSRALR